MESKVAAEPIDLEAIRERCVTAWRRVRHLPVSPERVDIVKALAGADALLAEVDRLNSARADLAKEFIEAVKAEKEWRAKQAPHDPSGRIQCAVDGIEVSLTALETVARAHGIEI